VGGHVDAQDAQPRALAHPCTANAPAPGFNPLATLRTAWLRELSEELHASPVHLARVRLHGLVYEGQTAIGRVHLGVVFVAQWCGPKPPQPPLGEALHPLGFLPLVDIATDTRFEHWSRLVAQNLLATSPKSFAA
jgi:predicted NUDIX family phosphoesterase